MDINKYSKCLICGSVVHSLDYIIELKHNSKNINKKSYLCAKCFYELLYTTKPTKHFGSIEL